MGCYGRSERLMAILLGSLSGGMQPSAPTIGTATAGDTTASVAFTASSYIGKGTITYTATSSPGGFTATGSSSPLTVTGLTNGTAYTFTVVGTTNYGVSSVASAASNSITPASLTAYQSIATVSVGSGGASSITFSSIPSTFTHLQVRGITQTNRATYPFEEMRMTFNGDTSAIYYWQNLDGDGSSAYAQNGANQNYIQMDQAGTSTANNWGPLILDILDYKETSKFKAITALAGASSNISYGGYMGVSSVNGGAYLSTTAISSINIRPAFSSQFNQYTQLALYGIKGV